MHLARAGLILALGACSKTGGAWREQYVFVGDDGTVVPLVVQIPPAGPAEAKGWLGMGGSWRSSFYGRFPVAAVDRSDVPAALAAWSRGAGAPARIALDRTDGHATISVRTRSLSFRVEAPSLAPLGEESDPEGVSQYRAGRAVLAGDPWRVPGWLLIEATPPDRPRRPFVSYGDFVFIAAARADGTALVLKHAAGRAGFDHAVLRTGERARRTGKIAVDRRGDLLGVHLPDLGARFAFTIRDRTASAGVAPDGTAVSYETALLEGPAAGVAFAIRPGGAGSGDPP